MSETFRCEDKETLIAYLYGEIDADGCREVERHLRGCAPCTRETEQLQAVRRDLEAWMPPEADLGVTMVHKPATVLRPGRWSLPASLPAWARVAAAVLVIGVGAAIANIQMRYDSDGLTITTGWMAPAPVPATVQAPPAQDWRPALTALESNLRTEMAEMRRVGAPAVVAAPSTPPAGDTAAILRRVQALLTESEERQRQELALRLMQVRREVDMNRQTDLMRIERGFGTLQNRAFKVENGQQEVMNLMRRVSVQPNQ